MNKEKFKDLLDEDYQGTRRCDAWFFENIEQYNIDKDSDAYRKAKQLKNGWGTVRINDVSSSIGDLPHYITGNSVDPIEKLCEDYMGELCSIKYYKDCGSWHCEINNFYFNTSARSHYYKELKLAIGEALFNIYQEDQKHDARS